MKRKFAMVLCMAACTGLLFGCGQKGTMGRLEEAVETMAAAEDTGDMPDGGGSTPEAGNGPESGVATSPVSEYLGEGKKILYKISALDKDCIPDDIYFFEDGKMTCLNKLEIQNKLGVNLTMGELSKMTDEAIWAKLDEYREVRYNALSDAVQQLKENKLRAGIIYMAHIENGQDTGSLVKDMLMQAYRTGRFAVPMPDGIAADEEMYLEIWADTFPVGQEEIEKTGEEVCAQMESLMPEMKGLEGNVPVAFILQTDATGNNVDAELVVWMDADTDAINKIVMLGKEMTGKIYDSDYTCYTTDGRAMMLCVRDETEIVLDETDSAGVLVDVPVDTQHAKEIFE